MPTIDHKMAEATTTKVFVGNLSFKTKEAELAAAFSQAGNVVSSNIITRGLRSLGYGFVELENQAAAEKAIQLLNKHTLDGREINVEIAKPREEIEKTGGGRPPRPSGGNNGPSRGGPGGGMGRGRGRGGRGRGRGRGGYRGRGGSRRRGGGRGGGPGPVPTGETKPKVPSKTTLFVTNLPYSVEDKELGDIFGDYKVKSAYIVRRKNLKSKGFGFVEFESEEEQQKALEKMNKHVVQERELILRIANIEQPSAEGSSEPAAAAATPATTTEPAPSS